MAQLHRPGEAEFDKNMPMKRPGEPAEIATAYVMLADPLSSYDDRGYWRKAIF